MMFNDDTPETQENPLAALDRAGSLSTPLEVNAGDRVKGKVVRIGDTTSFVDYGGRGEAAIETVELMNSDGTPAYAVGDDIEAMVASVADGVTLTLGKGKAPIDVTFLDEAQASGMPLEGAVKEVNKGGLVVDVQGVRAFCPVAQIDLGYVADPSVFVGQHLQFRVLQWEKGSRNLVVSRRALLKEERDRKAAELRARLAVGMDLDGVVRRLAPFGAFIDVGGVEGLAHVSELSLSRVVSPTDILKEGQAVRVKVIKVEDLGGPKERISLSLKALAADPWTNVARDFVEGHDVEGAVVRLTDFGAFIELAPGVDGLIHVSELSHRPVSHPRDVVKVGDRLTTRILKVDTSKKRISLSLKALEAAPAEAVSEAPKAQVGQIVEGSVASVKNFGVFVNLPSLGHRVSGLVPRLECGEARGGDLARKFPVGSPVKAEIIQIDEKGRIRLSITAAQKTAEKDNLEDYHRSQPARTTETPLGPMAEMLRPLKEKMESGGN